MPNQLSWNTITENATRFAQKWKDAKREEADKQTFWNEFFEIFGFRRQSVASFENAVKNFRNTYSFIDLLWKGKLLVEHKSAGASLQNAESQAFDYIAALQGSGRSDDIPRYLILCNFQRFALLDIEPEEQLDLPLFKGRRVDRIEFTLADLPQYIRHFGFIINEVNRPQQPQVDLNLRAVELLTSLHDTLKAGGFSAHHRMRFLVRVLFCFFAQKTRIFEPDAFTLYVENHTRVDGSDLGAQLNVLFEVLDTPEPQRQTRLDDDLKQFPYVNGELFKEQLRTPGFDGPMRKFLLQAAGYKWDQISPAIFGSLFQSVMDGEDDLVEPVVPTGKNRGTKHNYRRRMGAHYTSERDILKVIHPLFLDKLREEFASIHQDRSNRRAARLEEFRVRLTRLKFLDPACGCGNFLVVAYRELRALELDVLKLQHGTQQVMSLQEVNALSTVNVDQFYGIEIHEWPARIAEVALWLTDHQCNQQILTAFGHSYLRLPLTATPHILIDNALRIDWNTFLPATECSYVLGNPPFVGAMWMSAQQHDDIQAVSGSMKGHGVLDYVVGWYFQAAQYIQGTTTPVAFVTTNSISQGEQAGLLWSYLYSARSVKISFAYRTFPWESEAKGAAHVHVVIIGFAVVSSAEKHIYENGRSLPTRVANISPYLIEGPDKCVINRSGPLCGTLRMAWGNQPRDGGHFVLDAIEKIALVRDEPGAKKWLRPYVGGYELLHGMDRWCLWLTEITPAELTALPLVKLRVKAVQSSRLNSKAASTRRFAATPTRFAQISQPDTKYLAIPEVSSERRNYIPIAFLPAKVICSNTVQFIETESPWIFANLTSRMHMAWVRQIAGRLKSDYRYSNSLVYNNYPWPEHPNAAQKMKVEELAQAVLDARSLYPDSTLAQLYDPVTMPPKLLKAHQALDRAVEKCYRPEPFGSDRERVEYLFSLYEKLTAPLLPVEKKRRGRKAAATP